MKVRKGGLYVFRDDYTCDKPVSQINVYAVWEQIGAPKRNTH